MSETTNQTNNVPFLMFARRKWKGSVKISCWKLNDKRFNIIFKKVEVDLQLSKKYSINSFYTVKYRLAGELLLAILHV